MLKHNFLKTLIPLILLAAVIIVTGLATEKEIVWGGGLAFLLILVLLIPPVYMRAKHLGRYDPAKALARWRYSPAEAERVARDVLEWQKKRNRWIAPFTGICLAIIGGIFAIVLHEEFPDTPVWQLLLLLLPVSLPWIIRGLYWQRLKDMVLREPCHTVLGRDFLLWGNTRPVFNEREALMAVGADFVTTDKGSYIRVIYRSIGRLRYGGIIEYKDSVSLLVPFGCEYEASGLADTIREGNGHA